MQHLQSVTSVSTNRKVVIRNLARYGMKKLLLNHENRVKWPEVNQQKLTASSKLIQVAFILTVNARCRTNCAISEQLNFAIAYNYIHVMGVRKMTMRNNQWNHEWDQWVMILIVIWFFLSWMRNINKWLWESSSMTKYLNKISVRKIKVPPYLLTSFNNMILDP